MLLSEEIWAMFLFELQYNRTYKQNAARCWKELLQKKYL